MYFKTFTKKTLFCPTLTFTLPPSQFSTTEYQHANSRTQLFNVYKNLNTVAYKGVAYIQNPVYHIKSDWCPRFMLQVFCNQVNFAYISTFFLTFWRKHAKMTSRGVIMSDFYQHFRKCFPYLITCCANIKSFTLFKEKL